MDQELKKQYLLISGVYVPNENLRFHALGVK